MINQRRKMSGGFTFPPPPPPPPKAFHSQVGQQGQEQQNAGFRGRGRGRGNHRGNPNQRGRGQSNWRGNYSSSGYQQQSNIGQYGNRQTGIQQNNPPLVPYQQYGQYPPPAEPLPPGAFFNPNFTNPQSGSNAVPRTIYTNQDPQRQGSSGAGGTPHPKATSPPRSTAGHKRKLEALRGPPQERTKKPGRQTAPAVPSFGAPIISTNVQPSKNSVGKQQTKDEWKPTSKSLGLTPGGDDIRDTYSDSENEREVDEEAMYAELGNKLTFEHNGIVMSLKSQADLEAWKKERQKNWPTRERMAEKEEERRRIGLERKRLLGSAASLYSGSQTRNFKSSRKADGVGTVSKVPETVNGQKSGKREFEYPNDRQIDRDKLDQAKAELADKTKRLEDLRKKVAESEAKNREARAQKDEEDNRNASIKAQMPDVTVQEEFAAAVTQDNANPEPTAEDEEEQASDILADSSQGYSSVVSSDLASEPDSNGNAPEEVPSKPPGHDTASVQKRLCRYFAASGYCRDGDACAFRHERCEERTNTQTQQHTVQQRARIHQPPVTQENPEKKSIFQRLVEQEQTEEDRRALRVIKYLGKTGFFDENSSTEM